MTQLVEDPVMPPENMEPPPNPDSSTPEREVYISGLKHTPVDALKETGVGALADLPVDANDATKDATIESLTDDQLVDAVNEVTENYRKTPTPSVSASILGQDISVIHLEQTDVSTRYGVRNPENRYSVETTEGIFVVSGEGILRRNLTCPGIPPVGNECTHTQWEFEGQTYGFANTQSGTSPDHSIGVVLRDYIRDLEPAGSRHGVNLFRTTASGAEYRELSTTYGGWGEWSVFFVVGPNLDLVDELALFSTQGGAFGMLYEGGRPSELDGGATWRGAMVGRTINEGIEVDGKSTVAYDFSEHQVDVVLSGIGAVSGGGTYSGPTMLEWKNLQVNYDASFYIPRHGNDQDHYDPDPTRGYIDGDFYGPSGQEVAGVFEKGNLIGAFGGERD